MNGQYGALNDKTIVRFDDFVKKIRDRSLFGSVFYFLLSKVNGIVVNVAKNILYFLCDGGYHKWRNTVSANQYDSTAEGNVFKTRIESIRKDAEDTFGRLKKIFAILKLPIMLVP